VSSGASRADGAERVEVATADSSAGPTDLRGLARAFTRTSSGGRWSRIALCLGAGAALAAIGLAVAPAHLEPLAGGLALVLSALAAASACLGAREAAAPEGRATWLLLGVGAIVAAMGQALYARADLLGQYVAFPSMGFHMLVVFHFAFAEGAILALRPAHEGRLAAEIALDGLLVLLGASALVLRLVLDEPLSLGLLDLPQVVAILIGQTAVTASLLFVSLLVVWKDTALAGPVVDGLLVAAIFFTFGDVLVALGVEPGPDSAEPSLDVVRALGWVALFLSAGLATVWPQPSPPAARRETAARRFRHLIIPGAALFLAVWAVDAARRETVTTPSLVVVFLMGVTLAARIGTALYAIEQESVERRHAEQRAARARLRAVSAQMNPHFLFNALHSLSALVRRDPFSAQRTLERLGGLLRYGLDSGEEMVLFRQEWAFAKGFLEMEEMRLGSRLTVETAIAPEAMDLVVPPFILQPLVENAIRYGVTPFPRGGKVSIAAAVRDQTLVIEVRDSGPGADPPALLNAPGVGIRGVRAQLEAHFGPDARLDSERPAEGGFVVRLVIPAEHD